MKAVGPSGAAHNLRAGHADRLCYGGTDEESRHGATHFEGPNLESTVLVLWSAVAWLLVGRPWGCKVERRGSGVGSRRQRQRRRRVSSRQDSGTKIIRGGLF
jgi:hypothetical protein